MAGPDGGDRRYDAADNRNNQDATQRLSEEVLRPAAGNDRWAQGDVRSVTNSDGTVTQRFPDGTSTRVDSRSNPPKVLEINSMNGDKTTFTYKDGGQQPTAYQVEDANGRVKEKASKHGDHWKIERENADGKYYKDKSWDIKDLKLQPDGRMDLVDKDGLQHERQRNGNYLRRAGDGSGRVLAEMTPSGKLTEYNYDGRDMQPSAFSVKDHQGNIVEHGARDGNGWSLYRPAQGEQGLDPKNPEDAGHRVAGDKADRVVNVVLDQRTGKRVEVHGDGSANWNAIDDDRTFRKNPDNSMTVVGTAGDGNQHLLYMRDKRDMKFTFNYGQDGSLVGQKIEDTKGGVRNWTKDGEETWKDDQGRTMHARAQIGPDGSVNFKYMEQNNILTWNPTGSEVVRHVDESGLNRVLHTTDCHGKETQFKYSEEGALSALHVTFPNGQTADWVRGSDNGNEVWNLKGTDRKYKGSPTIDSDGSIVWQSADGRKQKADLRGIDYDVTPAGR